MYTFRYHLVTICAVFVALALGVLLGAAIASNEMVQSTSDGMVESMLSRYEDLVDENDKLQQDAEVSASLAQTFMDPWSEERLDGRTIVLLLGTSVEDRAMRSNLTETLTYAGASVVNVSVLNTTFGLDDSSIRDELQSIVPEVSGEDYQQTLAKKLVKEWSYVYTTSSTESTQADLELIPHVYTQPPDSTSSSVDLDGGLEPKTPFQTILFDQYPLTRALLSLNIISISVDYSLLANHAEPSAPTEQQAALHVATVWQLPYGVNGLINGFAPEQGNSTQTTQMGIQLAQRMQVAGDESDLSYPAWLRSSLPKATSGDVALPNYYVLLIQMSESGTSMESIASANNLSCVTTPASTSGQYSIIALLSGAQAGIYGDDRSVESRYAPLPEDSSGRAAFR